MKPRTKNKTLKKSRNNPGKRIPPSQPPAEKAPQRINQILSLAGLTSRRNADQWIKSGRITLNGRVVNALGTRAVWGTDSIKADGKEIPKPSPRVYLMLNKPFGYVCTLKDPQGRHLVTDLLDGIHQRVYPVGRLDFDSLGLLLLTNDGEFAFRLTHPRYQVPRTYKVTVEGNITQEAMRQLSRGVRLEDGFSGPAKVTPISRHEEQSSIRMTITQGKSRQVRRMLEAVGYKTIHLLRIGFGGLALGDLKIGRHRFLDEKEVDSLKKMVGLV